MSEWKILSDLVERKICYGIVQPGNKGGSVPIIKVNNIIAGLNTLEDLETTTEEIASKYERTKLKGGELIISLVGTVGVTAIVPHTFAGCNLVRATGMIDIEDEILARYVKYFLETKSAKEYLYGRLNTTVQPTLNVKTLENLPIPIINRQIMNTIVSILSALDDKIAINRRICENLEAQAQALFKHWFIDFAPFKDGQFVESELGMIPEGWRVGKLGEIAEITMGQSPSGSSYNEYGEGIIFYQGRTEFGFRFPGIRLYTTEPKRYAEPLSTLLSVRAPVGDINVAIEKCCIGRGLASIKSNCSQHSYIYYLLLSMKRRFNVYNGEGTVFGSINKDNLNGMSIVIPPISVTNTFDEIAKVMDNKILKAHQENLRLSTLRDTLLPKLMSGQIKV